MARKPVYGDRWSESPLERAERMGKDVYLRALSRRVSWSPVKQKFCPQEVDCEEVTLDKAFTSMVQYLQGASEQCLKYHANRDHVKNFKDAEEHCKRFHRQPEPTPYIYRGNPFKTEETIHLTLPVGAYSVTAHQPKTGARQTKIVQVPDNGCLTLTFGL